MDNSVNLPKEYFNALSLLAVSGPVYLTDIPETSVKLSTFLYLRDHGYAEIRLPNPNLLYLLPESRRDCYMVSITGEGSALYSLLKEEREQAVKDAAERKAKEEEKASSDRAQADQDRKEHFRHDWRIAVFDAFFGFILGVIADHFVDIVGSAVEIGRSVLLLSGH